MHTRTQLIQQAIDAAKQQDWPTAIEANLELIGIDAKDTGALNRLAVAYLQNNEQKKAKSTFKQVLAFDPSNQIAKKQLAKLTSNQPIAAPQFATSHFIEEPGKTKSVELHRLASRDVLANTSTGTECKLVPKNRYISIEANDKYLGALPEDLSFRLTKLIKNGNLYSCFVRTITTNSCEVFLREIKRSKQNEFINSFPLNSSQITAINDIDDAFLSEAVPLQIVDTDSDEEQRLDNLMLKEDEED